MAEENPFKDIETRPEDLEESKIRKEMMFDIEVSSESNRKIAIEFLTTLYKKHLISLFIGSFVAAGVLFTAFIIYGSITWVGALTERRMALNGGLLAMPVAMLLVMSFLERDIFVKDPWSLHRLGMQPFSFTSSKKALLMCLVPFQFLLVVGFSNDWTVNSSFLNPFYIIFIIGGLPVVIFEEVLFRGIYWKYLVIRFAKNKSMTIVFLINAFLFMIIHAPSLFVIYCEALLAGNLLSELAVILILFISYFISGLILTVLRDAHDNLLAPIVYHIAFNVIFLTFTMNGLWLIIIQAVIFLILLTIREMGWFKVSQQHHDKEAIHEFQRPILETPMHSVLRWFFLIGNGMVMFYYGSEMSRGNTPLLLVSSLVIVASYAILAFLYVKRLLFFKLSALMQ